MEEPIRKEINVAATTRFPDLKTLVFPLVEEVTYSPKGDNACKSIMRTEIKMQHVYKLVGIKGR